MLELTVNWLNAKCEVEIWESSNVGMRKRSCQDFSPLMKSPDMTEIRRRWVPEATGDVIEIGVGSGLNFRFTSQVFECLQLILRGAPSVCSRGG